MNTNQVYHYVYRITNIVKNKHYYGVRSCKILPKLDLGICYFSSSKDREFIKDQKSNPNNYKYKIVAITDTRINAVKLEIYLHNKFNVGLNSHFYNKAKQTATGFDTTGVVPHNKGKPHSPEARQKMSKSQIGNTNSKGKVVSEETRKKMSIAKKGKALPEEVKQKMSKAHSGVNHYKAKLANIYCRHTNVVIAENVVITVWANANNYCASCLLATAKSDRSMPSSKTNPHYTKGIYARYIETTI